MLTGCLSGSATLGHDSWAAGCLTALLLFAVFTAAFVVESRWTFASNLATLSSISCRRALSLMFSLSRAVSFPVAVIHLASSVDTACSLPLRSFLKVPFRFLEAVAIFSFVLALPVIIFIKLAVGRSNIFPANFLAEGSGLEPLEGRGASTTGSRK